MGSNPTHGVDVSEVEFASEVGDGGEDAVLCAVDVGGRMKNFFYCIIWWNFNFCYPETG